jgi:hypothetical protein
MVLVQEELQKAKGLSTAATVACETLIARAANKWQAQEGDYRDGNVYSSILYAVYTICAYILYTGCIVAYTINNIGTHCA